jgi:hypothetical protein
MSILVDNTLASVRLRSDNCVGSEFAHSGCEYHGCRLFPAIRLDVCRNVIFVMEILLEPPNLFQYSVANTSGATFGTGGRL